MKKISVAIDGPSGAGKTSMAQELAKKFDFIHVDTGAMYRTVGLFADRRGVSPTDRDAVSRLLHDIHIDIKYEGKSQHIFLNGEDVTGLIRTEKASKYASAVSAIPEVRAFLLDFQRSFAKTQSVIMDGRDIGTVVLPDADVKIFLNASSHERARRRQLQQYNKGDELWFEAVYQSILQRDKNDSERDVAPLRPSNDAVIVDTTDLTYEQTLSRLSDIIEERLRGS